MKKYYILVAALLLGVFAQSQTVVTLNSDATWTVPIDVYFITVEAWGGGGGGALSGVGVNGGGGGGGAYSTQTFSVIPNEIYTIVVGSGGTGGSFFPNLNAPASGGVSSFTGPGGSLSANGGGASQNYVNVRGIGGNGEYNGGNGAYGSAMVAAGGGGAAGNGGNGIDASGSTGGNGGGGTTGGGNGGDAGSNGQAPGGGGGGGAVTNGYKPGGSGGSGQVIITFTVGASKPTINSVSPNPVCSGDSVTITGTNFSGATAVTFSSNESAGFKIVSSTIIKAEVPAGAVDGPVTVTNFIGTSDPSDSIDIRNNTTPLSASVVGSGSYCGSAVLTASGGSGGTIYYQGTNENGTSTTLGGSTVTETTTGNNTFYFREFNSCGWATTGYGVTVTINAMPAPFTVSIDTSCNNVILTPSDMDAYLQTNPADVDESKQGVQTVTSEGTYYYRAKSVAGCWGDAVQVDVVFKVTAIIVSQLTDEVVCVGDNASFQVTATSGSTLSYQWRKGNTSLSDGGNILGATTATLTLSGVSAADMASDYNCIVTDACNSINTDFVSLTVNSASTTPLNAPTALDFAPVGITSAVGGFTKSSDANYYIVIRSGTATPVPVPTDGDTYTAGSSVFGTGTFVEYVGSDNSFVSSNLTSGKDYYYWVYAFNINPCGLPSTLYNSMPSYKHIKTNSSTECNSISTFYWMGSKSVFGENAGADDNYDNWQNWSVNNSSVFTNSGNSVPGKCDNVVIQVNDNINILCTDDSSFAHKLLFQLKNNTNGAFASLTTRGNVLVVYDDAIIDLTGGSSIAIGEGINPVEQGTVIFKTNVSLGATGGRSAQFLGNPNSKIIFEGSLTLGPSAEINNNITPGTVIFQGLGQNIAWNNTAHDVRFNDVDIKDNSIVTLIGSQTPDNILGNLTIEDNGQLYLREGKQWNRQTAGGTFTMSNTGRLLVYGFNSLSNDGLSAGSLPQGSNFPGGFETYDFKDGSLVYYMGKGGSTQTIDSVPEYNNLVLRNSDIGSLAERANPGLIKAKGSIYLENKIRWVLGDSVQHAGSFFLKDEGILMTGTQQVSGTGQFQLFDGGTLGIGSPDGITSSGATGNIQSNTRSYSSNASYIYNGSVNQAVGNGLPNTVLNLKIDNSGAMGLVNFPTHASPQNYEVTGTLDLNKGTLGINGNTVIVNGFRRSSGKFTGSNTSNLTVNNTSGIPLYFSGLPDGNILKELTFTDGGKGYLSSSPGDTLNITAGLAADGAGDLTLGNGSGITTHGNLTLKSNGFGTASVAAIPVDGSGNALGTITGNVVVERYINIGTIGSQHPKKWIFLATPAQGQTVKQSWMENSSTPTGYGIQVTGQAGKGFDMTSQQPSVKQYDQSASLGWTGLSSASTQLYNPRGWMVFIRGDRSVDGVITKTAVNTNVRASGTLTTGNTTFILPALGDDFESIGNPFASAINMKSVLDPGETFYVWDPRLGGLYGYGEYVSYSIDMSGDFVSSKDGSVNNNIQSGQAFFLQTSASPVTVHIEEADKTYSSKSNTFFRGQGSQKIEAQFRMGIYEGGDTTGERQDGTLQLFSDAFINVVNLQDGRKIMNNGINLSIKQQNKLLSIERRQRPTMGDTISINLAGLGNGKYTFAFDAQRLAAPGLNAWLEDTYTQTKTLVNLNGYTKISFTTSGDAASKAASRFQVVFKATEQVVAPVAYSEIDAQLEGVNILVSWQMAQEADVTEYEVEKSVDGIHFSSIGTVTASGIKSYSLTDPKAVEGYNYYRIHSLDKQGKSAYSGMAKVWMGSGQPVISVYPNPVQQGNINLWLKNQPKGEYGIRLFNPGGQKIIGRQISVNGTNHHESIKLSNKVAHGMYQLEVTLPDGSKQWIQVMN